MDAAPESGYAPPVLYRAEDLIEDAHNQLLPMQSRLHFLQRFQEELTQRTRGEEFIIFNDIVWQTLIDSRDKLVIDLASWAMGLYSSDGKLGHLAANCAPQLFVSGRINPRESEVVKMTLRHRRGRMVYRLTTIEPLVRAWLVERTHVESVASWAA